MTLNAEPQSGKGAVHEQLLEQAFPFYFVINDEGKITGCGESLSRVVGVSTNGDDAITEHFTIQHPESISTVDDIKRYADKFFLIKSCENSKLMLRGQVMVCKERNQSFFLVAPWVTELETLNELGLTLSDFPLHSPISDFLTLVQSQRASLNDSKRLSNELRILNRELEQRVERRTQALERKAQQLRESKQNLEHEIKERARVEVELRHANKLESVGQLAAGIAHEINTPIQYVGNSLQYLKNALTSLQVLSEKTSVYLSKDHDSDSRHELERTVSELDIEQIRNRAPKAIDRALEGISRVTQIVRAMNEFSYPDGSDMSAADINRALETTLTVAKSEYKYTAKIITELQPIPHIDCYLGDLNQVFLNLIVNAAHAISDSAVKEGVIAIKTWADDDNEISISISDNGIGIPENIRHRIFDPFFTTKEVGRGTGQGLAISHNIIVNKHAGRLNFTTESGKGTTFRIKLPVSAANTSTHTNSCTYQKGRAA